MCGSRMGGGGVREKETERRIRKVKTEGGKEERKEEIEGRKKRKKEWKRVDGSRGTTTRWFYISITLMTPVCSLMTGHRWCFHPWALTSIHILPYPVALRISEDSPFSKNGYSQRWLQSWQGQTLGWILDLFVSESLTSGTSVFFLCERSWI